MRIPRSENYLKNPKIKEALLNNPEFRFQKILESLDQNLNISEELTYQSIRLGLLIKKIEGFDSIIDKNILLFEEKDGTLPGRENIKTWLKNAFWMAETVIRSQKYTDVAKLIRKEFLDQLSSILKQNLTKENMIFCLMQYLSVDPGISQAIMKNNNELQELQSLIESKLSMPRNDNLRVVILEATGLVNDGIGNCDLVSWLFSLHDWELENVCELIFYLIESSTNHNWSVGAFVR